MKNYITISAFFLFTINLLAQVSLSKFPDDKVMVVAHRADWREAPENSIWAVKKAMEKGVDMIEIDIALTKDSVLILMHDQTIDRTTNGKGKPNEYTLNQIKEFVLKDGSGSRTEMKIPTLEEVLDITKGKILINLDKGFNYIDLVYPILKKRNMLDEILFKGVESYQDFNKKYGDIKDDIHYMPIVRLSEKEGWPKINDYLNNYTIYGIEFTVGMDETNMIDFKKIKDKGVKVWVNSLWRYHNAGHHDDLVLENPNVYDWYINNHVNMIQTDRINELIEYLKKRNLKN
ncbi:glycerophosphodiester phosphodiesterase family protein [Empedobacter falsenii]